MDKFEYYYMFSVTNQEMSFITVSKEELYETIEQDETLFELRQTPERWFKDVVTNEEFITGRFISDKNLSHHTALEYEITKRGLPRIIDFTNKKQLREERFGLLHCIQEVFISNLLYA